jgi:tRNA(Met) C34 N-acetyltransferase TmcA
LKHSKNNCNCDDFKSHFERLQHSVAMAFNVLELHWKIAAITTITTNSYNMSDFELQALQQYSYNISDLELLAVSYNSRQVVLQPNPSAATTFQAISYNSRKVGGGGVYSRRGQ